MTSIIEQADAIVGIAKTIGTCKRESGGFSPDTYRRGAYVEWLTDEKNVVWPHGGSLNASSSVEEMAALVVRLSRPKGDGVPETIVHCPNAMGHSYVVVNKLDHNGVKVPMSLEEQTATAAYLQRCLAPPVRRLLAAFEVVEQPSAQTLADDGERYIRITARGRALDWSQVRYGEDSIVCWLVPRGER